MQIAIQRPVGNERVCVVGGAADDGVEAERLVIVEQFPPVNVGFGFRKPLRAEREVAFIDVAEGDDVFSGERVVVRRAAAPDADDGDVEFAVRPAFGGEHAARHDGPGGSDGCGGL
ncbi:MAG: hypothetical protein A2107_10350 [Verrucomicrobia bacterium GWF2_62_7]|nr:MAG: hypothetical protein A2107_10350 [Verrucomicrobia bacterium GWF2_62_7]